MTDLFRKLHITPAVKRDMPYLLLSFALPFLVLGAMFAAHGVYPFGGRQIMVTDFWQQYYQFFSDYWHKLRGGQSLLWSWTSGGGINFLALIAYYLASPLNFLIVLFPHHLLREAVTLILMIKTGLAGLFFAMYLRYAKNTACSYKRCDFSIPAFSLFFALCAFTLGYYWNIMWFDTFALMPLVMLGVHALVREGRWKLYVIALALSVLINYYIGLFVCIFTVLMFIALCVSEKMNREVFLRKLLMIAVCSAVALGITAVLSVPTFLSLQKTYSAVNSFPKTVTQYENYFDILGNFIAFTPPTSIEGLPNLYCGMLSVLLLGPFARSPRIALRDKLMYAGIAAFLIVSCNTNVLNYIWHGFHFTNQLPYRFSFLVSFTVAAIAYRAYSLADEMNYWDLLAMGISGAAFLCFAYIGPQELTHVLLSAGLCAVYIAFFAVRIFAYRRHMKKALEKSGADSSGGGKSGGGISGAEKTVGGKSGGGISGAEKTVGGKSGAVKSGADVSKTQLSKKKRQELQEITRFPKQTVFSLILLVIVLAEITGNSYTGVEATRTTERDSYLYQFDEVQDVLGMREPPGSPGGDGFYRTESVSSYTLNDPAFYGYDGVSVFSSTVNRNTTGFMLGLGLHGAYAANRFSYFQSTPLTDAFLNIRYLYTANGAAADDYYYRSEAGRSGFARLLENKYYLPFGFMANEELLEYTPADNNALLSQNDLFRKATGLEGNLLAAFDMIHVGHRNYKVIRESLGNYNYTLEDGFTEGTLKWNYEMPFSGPLYFYIKVDNTKFADSFKIMSGDNELRSIRGGYPVYFCAGVFNQGDIISVLTDINAASGKAIIYATLIDHELFDRGYKILAAETMELTEFTGTRIKGTIATASGGLLYTSIPYEKGWAAYVDGKRAEILTVGGSMAALRLGAGTFEVEFRYINDGLVIGAVVSAVSLGIFAGMIILERRRDPQKRAGKDRPCKGKRIKEKVK